MRRLPGGLGAIWTVPPGRVESKSGGKAARFSWSASQATPQRPDTGSSVAPVVATTGAPCVRGLGTSIAPRRRAISHRALLIPALLLGIGLCGVGSAGGALIVGTAGADRLTGTLQPDELYGLGGSDRIDGRAASDLIDGGAGRDRLFGRAGMDRIISSGDFRKDAVSCGSGRDIVNADLLDSVAANCETVSSQISRDTGVGWPAQHQTQVEPDSFSFGSTIVTVFQSGRHLDGGAERNGFSTSRNGGRTWRSGLLPTGSFERVSDPVVAYDAEHKWWLAASLGTNFSTNGIVISRSRDGLRWRAPVDAARSNVEDYDKEWIACDNWRSSRFRGRCYVSYMNFRRDTIETRRSTDGGRTWSGPVAITVQRRPAQPNGIQIVTRPNGNVLLLLSIFGATTGNEVAQLRSTDGGVSFAQPVAIARLGDTDVSWLRAPPFVSADVDAAGTVYVAWRDCERFGECSADIVLMTSPDGVTWSEPARIPTGSADGLYFLPALAVDPATSGRRARLGVLYHSMSPSTICDPAAGCLAIDVRMVTSSNGGETWTKPQRLNALSMPPFWMADTSLGRMLGDYVSVSWARGRAIGVFSLAFQPIGGLYKQSIFATTRLR
jgi:RTX calcium-binding nonapeptide repeat (4 copies)